MEYVKFTIQALIGLLITGYIGSKITHNFQEKSFLNQIKIKDAESKVDKIINISKKINELSSNRRFFSQLLINSLLDDKLTNEELTELRKQYQDSVKLWNVELTIISIEARSIGMDATPLYLQNCIHPEFRKAHNSIRTYINERKDKFLLTSALENLNESYRKTSDLTAKLVKEAQNQKEKILNNGTEELSQYNLEKAKTYQLLIAIIHPSPNKLRVFSSR